MRRSRNVVAPLLASAAVSLLTACRTTEMQRCVDATNHVSDPMYCQQGQGHGSSGYYGGGGGGGYHYIYGGSGNYAPGSVVSDGSTTPLSGHSYSTTSGTSRGGFGGSFGGGEGGGGGE